MSRSCCGRLPLEHRLRAPVPPGGTACEQKDRARWLGFGRPGHRIRQFRPSGRALYLAGLGEAVRVERLPASAPEFNPVELLWGHLKGHEPANLTPDSLWKRSKAARSALFKTQKRPSVIQAFWVQADLPIP